MPRSSDSFSPTPALPGTVETTLRVCALGRRSASAQAARLPERPGPPADPAAVREECLPCSLRGPRQGEGSWKSGQRPVWGKLEAMQREAQKWPLSWEQAPGCGGHAGVAPPYRPPPKQELSLGHRAPLLASRDADTTRAAGLEVAVGEGRAAPPSPPRREVAGGPSPPPGASLHAAPVVISCDSAFPTGRGCEYSHFTEREPEALSGALPRSRCRPERGQQASPRDAAGDGSPE